MKDKIRKWLVSNFILESWVKLFGKTAHFLRAGRVLYPLTAIVGMIIATDPNYPLFQWYDFLLLGILFTGYWLGFSFFKWSYFNLWPVSVSELDDEQRHGHYRARLSGELTTSTWIKGMDEDGNTTLINQQNLTDEEWADYHELTLMLEEKYKGNFSGLWNLVPLAVTIILIAIWFFFLFPYFNQDFISTNPRFF